MKVVHIISSFGPGGAELLIKDLAINTRKDILVEIWAVGQGADKAFEEKFKNELFRNNVAYANIGKVAGKGRLSAAAKIRKLINVRKPDVINTHSELATFYTSLALPGTGVKLVQTIHNTVVTYPFLQRILARPMTSKFVAISDKCKRVVQTVIRPKEENIALINPGVNVQRFQQKEREIRPDAKNLMIIGRLAEQKDHRTLLKAFVILRDKLRQKEVPVPILNVVGTGDLKEELINFSEELGIGEFVKFLGARNDIPELLLQHDMWIMSSKWEGLSLALLEAMASGIPIVATDVGSNSEVIENNINGSLVEKENPAALAEAIYSLMLDQEKRKLYSDNSKIKVMDYSLQTCTKKYTDLHCSLMGNKAGFVPVSGMKKVNA